MTKQRDEERALHDYLDGRLSEEERKRFEARMEREPELARRVAACRDIGRSLREGDEELSPAFYTRARAAFEEASGSRAARSWFRPLSWETAGLAAVVLVAAALFVPGLVRAPWGGTPSRSSGRPSPKGPGRGPMSGSKGRRRRRARGAAAPCRAGGGPCIERLPSAGTRPGKMLFPR